MTEPMPGEEPPLRTEGALPVRDHLRPKPVKRAFAWMYHREADGRLSIDPVSAELAVAMTVEGEA